MIRDYSNRFLLLKNKKVKGEKSENQRFFEHFGAYQGVCSEK